MAISTNRNTNLTPTEAEALWRSIQGELGVWIAGTIRTMGVPTPLAEIPSASLRTAPGRLPDTRAIKRGLRDDWSAYDDIRQEVGVDFFAAAARGKVPPGDQARAYLYVLTRRRTWRVMTTRAREMRRMLEPTSPGDVAERIGAATPSPEQTAATRELLAELRRLLSALRPEDRELLLAAEDETYAALAERLGTREVNLRVRAHRLRADLHERLAALTDGALLRRRKRGRNA